MHEIEDREVACPYCGEHQSLQLDVSAGEQAYVEDCRVCCRPIEVAVVCTWSGEFRLELRRDDD